MRLPPVARTAASEQTYSSSVVNTHAVCCVPGPKGLALLGCELNWIGSVLSILRSRIQVLAFARTSLLALFTTRAPSETSGSSILTFAPPLNLMARGHDAVIAPGLHGLGVRAALRPQNGAVPDTVMLSVLRAFAVHHGATNENQGRNQEHHCECLFCCFHFVWFLMI